jgi:hypothetical protein
VALDEGDAAALSLQLSDGEAANVTLSLRTGDGLCDDDCPVKAGCPALGLGGDSEVGALAQRLAGGEVETEAVLMHEGEPVATIKLDEHGSVKEPLKRARQK